MSKAPPFDDSDTLLAHAGFLRGLARSLLFDRASADDVAQQALLAALKRGVGLTAPPAGFSLRGWLAGFVKNLVRQGTREEARRTAREHAAAKQEATPSAADTAARLELMQRVVGAVQQLEEPYRTAVLLRFFDGLPPRAIARRLGVPVETVRTRIKRGLEQLRRRLDARHDGDRIAWGALLLPTALSSGKGIVAGALAGTATQLIVMHGIGALAMSTKVKVMAGAAVALVATIVLVNVNRHKEFGEDGPRMRAPIESPAPAEVPQPEASIPVERATAQRLEEDRTSTTATADPSATFAIRGTTRLPDKSARGGLHVQMRLFDGYETDRESAVEIELVSDSAGAFVWALRPPKGTVTILARGAEQGYLSGEKRLLVLSGDAPGTLDVSFAPLDATVEGKVVDERGTPLPDAKVFNWYGIPTAECDEHGEFRVVVPSSHGQWSLRASAPGFAEARQTATLKGPGTTASVEFRLRPDFKVHGRITDESESPVPDAKIRSINSYFSATTSDAHGNFVMHSLDPLAQAIETLLVEHPEYAPTTVQLRSVGRDMTQDIVLKRGTRVEGVVFDQGGMPVRGAELWLGPGRFSFGELKAYSHDDGSFVFAHVAPGKAKVGAEKSGLPDVMQDLSVPAQPLLRGVVVRFGASHFLAGIVSDKSGAPIVKATVACACDDGSGLLSYDQDSRTDEQGRFRIDNLPANATTVMAYADGFMSKHERKVALDRDDVVFVLERAAQLSGLVVDAATNAPLEKFNIRFVKPQVAPGEMPGYGYESDWGDPGHTFEGTQGRWTTGSEAIPVGGVFAIEASADGYAPALAPHVIATPDPDPDALVLRLDRGARISGRVLGEGGAVVAGAQLLLGTKDQPVRPYGGERRNPRWVAHTDSSGAFSFETAPSGECTLVVSHAEWTSVVDGPFVTPSGGAVTRVIRLERGGRIDGVLIGDDDLPEPGRVVMLFPPTHEGPLARTIEVATDGEGRFVFDHLATGVYQVSSQMRHQYRSVNDRSARVSVVAPQSTHVRIEPGGRAVLRGRVTWAESAKPSDLTVSLQWRGDGEGAMPDAAQPVRPFRGRGGLVQGDRFELPRLEPGRYRVNVYGHDRSSGAWFSGSVEVTVDETTPAEVEVRIAAQ